MEQKVDIALQIQVTKPPNDFHTIAKYLFKGFSIQLGDRVSCTGTHV